MADPTIDDFVAKSDGENLLSGSKPDEGAFTPQYRMYPEDRIPVSKGLGKIWSARKDCSLEALETAGHLDRWNEAYRYFRNDHSERADRDGSDPGNESVRLTTKGMETENLVFANTSALVPAVYAKNPTVEVSAEAPELQDWANAHERLINSVFGKKYAPGIDLKPTMKRGVLNATLANISFIELGYVVREQSSEQTLAELSKIGTEYSKTKDQTKLKELEAKMQALEEKVDLLRPSGPWAKFRKPMDVLFDPDVKSLRDSPWMMIRDSLPTDFIKVVYGKKNDKDEWDSIFQPTHVLKLGGTGKDDDQLTTFKLFNTESSSYKDYGYKDQQSFQKGQRTSVWYVWDKSTRRVLLFNENDWKWPIWVWQDPYELPGFFPIVPLEFYMDPVEMYGRSETTYYLDQQDALNMINNEIAKCRAFISGKPVYNKNILKDEAAIEAFLAGTSAKRALGVEAPPDADLTKLFTAFMPQSAQALNTIMFDKDRIIQAVDRVSSITNVMRGVEYKTNTTNKAIESYESNTQTRLDEKIDAVEDCLGEIGHIIGHMCVKFMDEETVIKILGEAKGMLWLENKPELPDLDSAIHLTIAGGSTLKPTSVTKKQQATTLGQIIGQFANAAPASVIVALKVLSNAFDEIIIREEDWKMIMASLQQQMQQPQQGAPQEGGKGAPQQQGASAEQVEQLIDGLPPPARQKFAELLAKGAPIKDAIQMIVQAMQQQPQPGQSEQGNGEQTLQ